MHASEQALDATIFVVVTNYRTPKDTEDTIRSLQASSYPHVRICVVDNGSGDDSVTHLRSCFPDLLILEVPSNEGVARAYNRGLRRAQQEGAGYILILNSDVELDHHCLAELVRRAGAPDQPVMLAPLMYYFQPRDKMWFAGGGLNRESLDYFHCETADEFRRLPMPDRYITACAMFMTREAARRTGLYDERFFMYWDDTDYSVTAVGQGVKLDMVETALLYHKISSSTGGLGALSPFKAYHMLRSSLIFWRKHLSWWRFHRDYCEGHLGKWVNQLPVWWNDEKRRPAAEAIMDAVWYILTLRNVPLQRPRSPDWFRWLMRTRPWLVARWMSFRMC